MSFGNGTVTGVQSDRSSGNPGFARDVVNDIEGGGNVRGSHKWLLFSTVVNPRDVGAITQISMSIDGRHISGVGGNGMQIGIGAEGGGVAFRAGGDSLGSPRYSWPREPVPVVRGRPGERR